MCIGCGSSPPRVNHVPIVHEVVLAVRRYNSKWNLALYYPVITGSLYPPHLVLPPSSATQHPGKVALVRGGDHSGTVARGKLAAQFSDRENFFIAGLMDL